MSKTSAKQKFLTVALTLLVSGTASTAQAATFSEGIFTDAGETLGTATAVDTFAFGTALDAITGFIFPDTGNADLFLIYLTGASFTADTNATGGFFGMNDTQLFLFNASGRGVVADDDSGVNLLSQFTIAAPTPGLYYLGISGYNYDPQSAGGFIFPGGGPVGPTGPGGASPLTNWAFATGTTSNVGTYAISLTGATFVPEPSSVLGLIALGGLGGGMLLKRRRKTTSPA